MKILVNFYANVSEKSVNDLIKYLTVKLARQTDEKPIVELIIQISSSGGSSDHGLLAYNFLQQISIPKTTIGMGNVDSAAVMIFCAGENRVAMPSCRFVLHEALATIGGQFTATKLGEMSRLVKRISDDYVDVITKVTGEKKQKIAKEVSSGSVLSSKEANSINLVTEIVEKAYLSDMNDLDILLINNPQKIPNQPQPPNNKAEV